MTQTSALVPVDTTEDGLVDLWIRGVRSPHSKRAYRRHIDRFRAFIGKTIQEVTLVDMYDFAESLLNLSENSQKIIMDVVKSYLNFAYRAGFLRVNVGAAFKALPKKETISERILSEYEVQSMIKLETDVRNHAILRVFYAGGLRCSELCNLRWKDVVDRDNEEVQLAVLGKGNKTRFVLIDASATKALLALGKGEPEEYIFQSDEAYHSKRITERQVQNIVKEAAKRAGIQRWADVSPHWMRHSHATHSIQRNAPLHVVRDTLGHSNISVANTYLHSRPEDSSARYLPKF